jgi:hypothetical protein
MEADHVQIRNAWEERTYAIQLRKNGVHAEIFDIAISPHPPLESPHCLKYKDRTKLVMTPAATSRNQAWRLARR